MSGVYVHVWFCVCVLQCKTVVKQNRQSTTPSTLQQISTACPACMCAFVCVRVYCKTKQAIDHIINSAAKINYMSGGDIPCPIVFRGPNGVLVCVYVFTYRSRCCVSLCTFVQICHTAISPAYRVLWSQCRVNLCVCAQIRVYMHVSFFIHYPCVDEFACAKTCMYTDIYVFTYEVAFPNPYPIDFRCHNSVCGCGCGCGVIGVCIFRWYTYVVVDPKFPAQSFTAAPTVFLCISWYACVRVCVGGGVYI